MRNRFLWLVLAVFWSLAASARDTGNAVVRETFDGGRSGFAAALLKDKHLSLAQGQGVDGSVAIKATYEGYERGSHRIEVRFPLPTKALEYTLLYDLRFCDGFQFVKGGKLPGVSPDRPVTGGKAVREDRWSARLMFSGRGGLTTYVYHQDLPGKYGQGVRARGFTFQPGQYYAISYHVRLNDPPSADNGIARVYVDGQELVRHENIRYRAAGTDDTLISSIHFSTFHGGHTPDWAPRAGNGAYTSVCAYFDNVAVYPGERVRAAPGQ